MFRLAKREHHQTAPSPLRLGGRASRQAPVRALTPSSSGHFSDFYKRRAGGGRPSRGRASTCGGSKNAKSSNPNRRRDVAVNGAILAAPADVLTVAAKMPPPWFPFRLPWFPAPSGLSICAIYGTGPLSRSLWSEIGPLSETRMYDPSQSQGIRALQADSKSTLTIKTSDIFNIFGNYVGSGECRATSGLGREVRSNRTLRSRR